MSPPTPPARDWLNIIRDVAALVLLIVGVAGVGVVLYTVAPVVALLYGFTVVAVAGGVLASGVGR